jgi:hypothetical protein
MEPETRPPSDVKSQEVKTPSLSICLRPQALKRAACLNVLKGRATPYTRLKVHNANTVVADDCWLQIWPRPGLGPGPGQRLYFRVVMGQVGGGSVTQWTIMDNNGHGTVVVGRDERDKDAARRGVVHIGK